MDIKKQIGNDFWTDEAKVNVPANRITKSEKLREKEAYNLAKEAQKINDLLHRFKAGISQACEAVQAAVRQEADVQAKEGKGNFTWFNFDRSIKIECSINEQIYFDDTLIGLCKEKLDEYIAIALEGSADMELVSQLVNAAFQNTKGRLDSKKVMTLLKYKSRIKSPLFGEAMKFLEDSIRRPKSKAYYRVYLRTEEGEYEPVNLNFSSI